MKVRFLFISLTLIACSGVTVPVTPAASPRSPAYGRDEPCATPANVTLRDRPGWHGNGMPPRNPSDAAERRGPAERIEFEWAEFGRPHFCAEWVLDQTGCSELGSLLLVVPKDYPSRNTLLVRQARNWLELATAERQQALPEFVECLDRWQAGLSSEECFEPVPDYKPVLQIYVGLRAERIELRGRQGWEVYQAIAWIEWQLGSGQAVQSALDVIARANQPYQRCEGLSLLAAAHEQKHAYEAALAIYSTMSECDEFPYVLYRIGWAQHASGRIIEALDTLEYLSSIRQEGIWAGLPERAEQDRRWMVMDWEAE